MKIDDIIVQIQISISIRRSVQRSTYATALLARMGLLVARTWGSTRVSVWPGTTGQRVRQVGGPDALTNRVVASNV